MNQQDAILREGDQQPSGLEHIVLPFPSTVFNPGDSETAQKEVTKGHVAGTRVLGWSFMTAENMPNHPREESNSSQLNHGMTPVAH